MVLKLISQLTFSYQKSSLSFSSCNTYNNFLNYMFHITFIEQVVYQQQALYIMPSCLSTMSIDRQSLLHSCRDKSFANLLLPRYDTRQSVKEIVQLNLDESIGIIVQYTSSVLNVTDNLCSAVVIIFKDNVSVRDLIDT